MRRKKDYWYPRVIPDAFSIIFLEGIKKKKNSPSFSSFFKKLFRTYVMIIGWKDLSREGCWKEFFERFETSVSVLGNLLWNELMLHCISIASLFFFFPSSSSPLKFLLPIDLNSNLSSFVFQEEKCFSFSSELLFFFLFDISNDTSRCVKKCWLNFDRVLPFTKLFFFFLKIKTVGERNRIFFFFFFF